jgi:hypothetical protein
MSEPETPSRKSTVEILSKLLMILGAVAFLIGDRSLVAFANWHFLPALVVSVLAGLALMALGASISKRFRQGEDTD